MAFDLIVGRPALLVIDMQEDFVRPGAPCYAVGAEKIIPRMKRVAERSRTHGIPVIFTQEAHRRGRVDSGREADQGTGGVYGAADKPVQQHCVEGTPGIEIVKELAPQDGDIRVRKPRYNSFLGSDLDILLRNLNAQTLLVTGVCSNVCVLYTVAEGFQRDYHMRVVEDCTAGTSQQEHDAALLIMRSLTTGRPITSADVIAELDGSVPEVTSIRP